MGKKGWEGRGVRMGFLASQRSQIEMGPSDGGGGLRVRRGACCQ